MCFFDNGDVRLVGRRDKKEKKAPPSLIVNKRPRVCVASETSVIHDHDDRSGAVWARRCCTHGTAVNFMFFFKGVWKVEIFLASACLPACFSARRGKVLIVDLPHHETTTTTTTKTRSTEPKSNEQRYLHRSSKQGGEEKREGETISPFFFNGLSNESRSVPQWCTKVGRIFAASFD